MRDTSRSGSVTIQLSRGGLLLLLGALLGPWVLCLILNTPQFFHRDVGPSPKTTPNGTHTMASSRGPWGNLRVVRIATEPPEESLSDYLNYPKPVWHLKGYTPDAYDKLLLSAGLSPAQRSDLVANTKWGAPGEGCVVIPTDAFALNLSPASRAVLYGALSLFPENTFQNEPFRFRADLAADWFADSPTPKAVLDLVNRLTYRRGKTLLFSDPHLVLPGLPSDRERAMLLKTLSRQSTLMVHLHVSPETDIVSLLSYWAPLENRAKDIRPLLESAARLPGGADIDIAHLLPRFARKRLYTYPTPEGDPGETVYDCHWNSMNFWNDPPDNRFSDSAFVIRTLETDYEQTLDNFRFGDVVLFMKSDTQAVHSAVYIADNIVFTKNGPSQHSPWILMQLDTLVSHYETNLDLTIRAYRKKKSGQ